MNGLNKVIWITFCSILVLAAISALIQSRQTSDARNALDDTRRTLRKQGFKTEFADFDFATDAATRARMAMLTCLNDSPKLDADGDEIDLMPRISDDAAAVIWKQDSLEIGQGTLQWVDLHAVLDTYSDTLNAACDAAVSGEPKDQPGGE